MSIRRGGKQCPQCMELVHPKARICPYCQSPQPTWWPLISLALFAAIVVAAMVGSGGSKSSTGAVDADAQWMDVHGNDPKAVDDKFGTKADAACTIGADDYLQNLAAYNYKWDDASAGILGTKFDKYMQDSPGRGLITYVTNHALLSNGFGAYSATRVYCLYDAAHDRVVKFSQIDPADAVSNAILNPGNEAAQPAAPAASGNVVWINHASGDADSNASSPFPVREQDYRDISPSPEPTAPPPDLLYPKEQAADPDADR